MSAEKIHKIHRKISALKSLLKPATLLEKRLQHRCFPVNITKFLRSPFFYRVSPSDCFSNKLLLTLKYPLTHFIPLTSFDTP